MREKILVIDDQAEVRDYLATVLDRAGFEKRGFGIFEG